MKPIKQAYIDGYKVTLFSVLNEYVVSLEYEGEKVYKGNLTFDGANYLFCLLYTSPSPRDRTRSRMPSSA